MNIGDIVTVVTISGEYVGKLAENSDNVLKLEDPRMLIQTQEGMGFAKGICVTGAQDPKDVSFNQYVFVTGTNDQVADAWRTAVTGIVI